jgi:hypothetical protein
MPASFTTAQPRELFDIDTTCRILTVSPERVLHLIQDGTLRARNVNGELRVDSASVDRLSDRLDVLIAQPPPETYVKLNGRAYREIATPHGTVLQKI